MKLISLLYGPQELGQTFFRYLPAVIRSRRKLNFKKIFNAMYAEYERRRKRVILKSHPFVLHIELTNVCNLKCPYCLTGNNSNGQDKGFMTFEQFKSLIDDLKDYLILVRLDGVGESFLNKDFYKMVEYASKNNIITSVSTNFVKTKEEETVKLIESGLDYLIVGIDGATEETYQKVRTGGNLEQVKNNIKYLVNKKNELKSKLPFVETQFITFDENYMESDMVKQLSHDLGADRHLIKDLRNYAENVEKISTDKSNACYWLWYVVNLTWQGDIKACCLAGLASEFSFGNIYENKISEEWNNTKMQNIRKLFSKKDPELMKEFEGCICIDCYKF